MTDKTNLPFIFGTQYYRAPTPPRDCWADDLARMRALGFNHVKYSIQWRWTHRAEDVFYFDDIDELMELASNNDLAVTFNLICDVSPIWLFDKYPDAKQVLTSGAVVEPYAVAHRQIGGHPGPCYNHLGAAQSRQQFITAAVNRYKDHPAAAMWNVWNEPEQSFLTRIPNLNNLVCYCDHCRKCFKQWLINKYGQISRLNDVWGRCYVTWEQVEIPLTTETIVDFIDWREFHLDTLKREADWRLAMVKELAPKQLTYLHVVPNTMHPFNSVTCVDDFAMAQNCDIFAATMNADPVTFSQVVSAGNGKTCYNVESHINFGATSMHQRRLQLSDVLQDLLEQIGWDIKGFLFWQYRPETLGFESPAWGIVNPDGSDRTVTPAIAEFYQAIAPFADDLMLAHPQPPQVAIWKSRRNELFHFCIDRTLDNLAHAVNGYINALYFNNIRFRIVNEAMLENAQLDGVKLLIMPSPYYLSADEAAALDQWVRQGGILLTEAHLAGYNATIGRHSSAMPGCGLAQSWQIAEQYTTAACHLNLGTAPDDALINVTEDTKKALKQSGKIGSNIYPMMCKDGKPLWAASRFACLAADRAEIIASLPTGQTCLIRKNIGQGEIWYCGGNIAQAASQDESAFDAFLLNVTRSADITPTADAPTGRKLHVDLLTSPKRKYLIAVNPTEDAQKMKLPQGKWQSIFNNSDCSADDATLTVPPMLSDLLVSDRK